MFAKYFAYTKIQDAEYTSNDDSRNVDTLSICNETYNSYHYCDKVNNSYTNKVPIKSENYFSFLPFDYHEEVILSNYMDIISIIERAVLFSCK